MEEEIISPIPKELLKAELTDEKRLRMTWFRGMEERRGIKIHWINVEKTIEERIKIVKNLLSL